MATDGATTRPAGPSGHVRAAPAARGSDDAEQGAEENDRAAHEHTPSVAVLPVMLQHRSPWVVQASHDGTEPQIPYVE